jgi:hypothetical protein
MVGGGHCARGTEIVAGIENAVIVGCDEDLIDGLGGQCPFVGVLEEVFSGGFGDNFPLESSRSVSGWYYDQNFHKIPSRQ